MTRLISFELQQLRIFLLITRLVTLRYPLFTPN